MMKPLKLNAAMIAALAEAIGDGLPDRHAAALCGIGARTLKAWRAAGKTARGNSLLARLDRELARADAAFIQHHARKIAEAKPGAWQASAWLLERKFRNPSVAG